jgi:palmitoyl-protein thioesterase
MDAYLKSNRFLTSINNEMVDTRNETYAHNLASLENLVLVLFKQDNMVIPKESAWFGSEAAGSEDEILPAGNGHEYSELLGQIQLGATSTPPKTIIPMRRQPLYTDDWIGLRELDEKGGVVLETCEGVHMHLEDCWERLVKKFAGGVSSKQLHLHS